jgi:hypothetical protein
MRPKGIHYVEVDVETTPLRYPELYQYDMDLGEIAEVWRRGSVVASWLLDLTAAALIEDADLNLEIDSWRWRGVPFYIRAGKNLPVTCTEITFRLHQAPTMYRQYDVKQNYFRFRVSPEIIAACGVNAITPGSTSAKDRAGEANRYINGHGTIRG